MKKIDVSLEQVIAALKAPIRSEFIGKESEFEKNVLANLPELCEGLNLPEIMAVETQRIITLEDFLIKPDIIIRHTDETVTILEVKKTNNKYPCSTAHNQLTAIGQLLLYGNVIQGIANAPVRLAMIDSKIAYRTYCAFSGYNLPITLIELQKNRVLVPYYGWGKDEMQSGCMANARKFNKA